MQFCLTCSGSMLISPRIYAEIFNSVLDLQMRGSSIRLYCRPYLKRNRQNWPLGSTSTTNIFENHFIPLCIISPLFPAAGLQNSLFPYSPSCPGFSAAMLQLGWPILLPAFLALFSSMGFIHLTLPLKPC